MNIKLLGAILIISGCGGFGFFIALSHKRETAALKQLLASIEFMQCELQYRMAQLPSLCNLTAEKVSGPVQTFWLTLGKELEQQISPNIQKCTDAAIAACRGLPPLTQEAIQKVCISLGKFDLDGQLMCFESLKKELQIITNRHCENQDMRLRSYQTLGLCAGAAIAILLV